MKTSNNKQVERGNNLATTEIVSVAIALCFKMLEELKIFSCAKT